MSDLPNIGIAEQYRKKLSSSRTMLESAAEGNTDLPDSEVQDRSQAARENLYRVIKEYLGDEKELYDLAEQVTTKGSDALRAVANNDDIYLINNPESMVFLEVIVVRTAPGLLSWCVMARLTKPPVLLATGPAFLMPASRPSTKPLPAWEE